MNLSSILKSIVLCSLIVTAAGEPQHNLTFMFITSFGQGGFNSSRYVPAADMALEDINQSPNILDDYYLMYDKLRDSECRRVKALDEFFDGIQSKPVKIAMVGCGCSPATEPVAEISHHWNISQISYASSSTTLVDRNRFRRYFRNSLTFVLLLPTLHSIIQRYNWTRIALLTQNENLFTATEAGIRFVLKQVNITVESRMFRTGENPIKTVDDLFLENEDYRVFFLNTYSRPARRIICEAHKKGFTYPYYAWIAFDWYPQKWWTRAVFQDDIDCTDEELAAFLDKAITLRRHPTQEDVNATTTTGITQNEFAQEFSKRAPSEDIAYGGILYDVIWSLAIALNETVTMIEEGNTSIAGTGCEGLSGTLVPLEQFSYNNELMGCLIQRNLQRTNFSGVSGTVVFDEHGTRVYPIVRIKQYHLQGGELIKRDIAFMEQLKNGSLSFRFFPGINDDVIYPERPPPDGSPVENTHTFSVALVVLFDTLATLGIAFCVCCLLFNFIFKDRRIVKLTSPNLNYFIILGAALMYISTYFYLMPSMSRMVVEARCILEHWLFTLGYTFAFATMLAKMWRVYHIFHNPTPDKRHLKDYHLVFIILVVTGIAVLLLVLKEVVPQLRGSVTKEIDTENPSGKTDFRVRVVYVIWVCYEASSHNFFWRIFIFSYLAILQIVGILLAFQTRRVKVKGLNDSKYVAMIIYISSIVLVALALVTFALRSYINIGTGVFVAGIFTLTTIFLALSFIPKMVLLYKDPQGERVGTCTSTRGITTVTTQADRGDTTTMNTALANKVAALEKTITELRNENESLKENAANSVTDML